MASIFAAQGKIAARRPWTAIGIIAILTIGFSLGFAIESGPTGDQTSSFLPPGSKLAQAQEKISEDFAQQSTTIGVQIIVRGDRGDLLSPAGLQEVIDAFAAVSAHADVAPYAIAGGAFSPAHMLLAALQDESSNGVTQTQIDETLALLGDAPQSLLACGGGPCTAANTFAMLGVFSLNGDVPAEQAAAINDAQLGVEAALDDFAWQTVEARSFSGAKLNQESGESQGASTGVLMGVALGIILLLLVVFYRTGSDVALSIGGLVLTIVWVYGLQGILGPGGLGLIGADSPFAMMIPILLIGLTVDYALQFTGRYREHLSEGEQPRKAIFHAVKHSGLPLLLAAATTAVSFLTNVISSLPPMQDFGIIAAIGVMMGWFVMITFVPAVRAVLDARRQRRGKTVQSRHMADAIPGIGKAIGSISGTITNRPMLYMSIAAVVSIVAAFGAVNVSTSFSQTDFLPANTESYDDLLFLDENFAGGDATTTLLIEGDLEDAEVLRALVNLEFALADEATRPDGVTGAVRASFLTLAVDWAVDDGLPGDKYDSEVAPMLQELDRFFPPADALHAIFDKLQAIDPAGFNGVMAIHANAPDRTILVVPVTAGSADETSKLVRQLEKLWSGDPDAFFVTGASILEVAVLDEMTDSQIQSVIITIAAALVLLIIFFGITERKPALGVITVLPIGLVVLWVLGTMALLGISYNVMTALITALTIGVGVDYTIHITHRFLEEHAEKRGVAHAVKESLSTTGGALIGSALTTALGFGVLLFSPLVPMQQFGGLTALTIVFSLIAAFFVLPPMLVLWALFDDWRGRQALDRLLEKHDLEPAPSDGAVTVVPVAAGNNLRCPKCKTSSFVPHSVARMKCAVCSFTGRNPHKA